MRIALVIEQLDLSRGGAERSTFEFAEKLAMRGLKPIIITGKSDSIPQNHKSEIVDLNIRAASRLRKLIAFCNQSERFIRMQSDEFDIIHAITPIKSADIYQPRGGLIDETHRRNVMRRKGFGRLLKQITGPNLRQRYIRRLEYYLAMKTNCKFLAVSDYVRRQCLEHLKLSEDRIKVIFNSVEFSRLQNCPLKAERRKIRANLGIEERDIIGLFIANNFRLKGLELIINTLADIRRKQPEISDRLKVLVAGTDKIRVWFNRVAKLGIERNVIFIGPVQDVSLIYGICNFLIHPTWYDPCSRVVLEAIAMKLPVITSIYNGASELVKQANCGYVIENLKETDELSNRIANICNERIRERFRENTQRLVSQINMETHINNLIEFYRYCLEMKKQ